MIARHLVIEGRVQGVSFRDWAVTTARGLGLTGWVRNRRDGRVELLAIGSAEHVGGFVEACREGPSGARVENVHAHDAEAEPLSDFERRPTA